MRLEEEIEIESRDSDRGKERISNPRGGTPTYLRNIYRAHMVWTTLRNGPHLRIEASIKNIRIVVCFSNSRCYFRLFDKNKILIGADRAAAS